MKRNAQFSRSGYGAALVLLFERQRVTQESLCARGRSATDCYAIPRGTYSLQIYTAPPTATTETAVAVIVIGEVRIASAPAPIDANVPAI